MNSVTMLMQEKSLKEEKGQKAPGHRPSELAKRQPWINRESVFFRR